MSLYGRLREREQAGKIIMVAAHGSGWMAGGFAAAMRQVPGLRLAVLCSEQVRQAVDVMKRDGGLTDEDILITDDKAEAEKALDNGLCVITSKLDVMCALQQIDIVTDVTPSPAWGIAVAEKAFENGKDVVLVNIEADVTAGAILRKKAAEADVLYSVSSGDEPGCLMELLDFVQCLGYEPIVIGKGKNNPLNIDANPDTVRESALKADKDPAQVASYVDGTKTMFELCCVSNATGYMPIQRGMVGPKADLSTVSDVFRLKEDGGIVPKAGAVDYVQGNAMSGGVFITVKIDNERVADDLGYLKVGKGPYFTFFRPYHLWFLEAPISIAEAFLDKKITLASRERPVSDVVTMAKKDMEAGEQLDEFGGYTFRGEITEYAYSRRQNALPAGLAPGAMLKNGVQKGDIITWEDVTLDESSAAVRLRREMDLD